MIIFWLPKTIRNVRQKLGATKLSILRKLGLIFCRDCIQVDMTIGKKIERDQGGKIKIYALTEENIHPTNRTLLYQEAEELESLQPLIAKTETVVMDIRNPKFSFRNNHLIDNKNNVLYEPEISFDVLPIYSQKLSPITRLKGTVAYLSNTDTSNYYHWMCLTLPLLRFYQKYLDLNDIDFFYVGESTLTNFQKETLLKLGISADRVIQKGCRADRLIVAIPHRKRHHGHGPIEEETYKFIRNMYQREININKGCKKRRIYIARGESKRRKVINELEVGKLLKKYNFDIMFMDDKTVIEQAEIFSEAEAIIAPHGAALTNLLFVQPGVKVLEIFPYNYLPNYYYVMSSYAKAEYYYLRGENCNVNNEGNIADILIDLEKLEKFCNKVLKTG